MKIFHSLDNLPAFKNLVLTQGTFDGVHLGHKKVLQQVVQEARARNGESMLLTFYPHPRLVIYPDDNSLRMLSSLKEKEELIAETGIDYMLVLPFTSEISNLSPLEFVKTVLVNRLAVNTMIVGYDHRFGKNREGSFTNLMEMGEMFNFSVHEIPASEIEEIAISSTRIRKALLNGELSLANELLGRPYSLTGKVIHGDKRGREIGFPTANIMPDDQHKLIPCSGVYAIHCTIGVDKFQGVANVGHNPTFPGKGFSIEAHLFDFSDNIYELATRLEFNHYLRPEQKFNNVEELKNKIKQDVENARSFFASV